MGKKILRLLVRILGGFVILLVVLLAGGFAWQTAASRIEARMYPAPGKLVDMGGYRLHLYCTGDRQAGQPEIVLESGAPEWSLHWQKVQPELSKTMRVCSYDRAGYGWSDPGPEPRTVERIAGELHELLARAGEGGPYVLVAHSLWGPAALEYQHEYPGEVAGMVLIETWSPELLSPMPEPIAQTLPVAGVMKALAPFGVPRMIGESGLLPLDELLKANLLPDELQPVYRAQYYAPKFWQTYYDEYAAMEESAREMAGETIDLGSLPQVVIQAGEREAGDYPSDEVWHLTLLSEAALSRKGKLVIAENSGHFVQLEDPEFTVQVIRDVYTQK